jgi:hypothetical protein
LVDIDAALQELAAKVGVALPLLQLGPVHPDGTVARVSLQGRLEVQASVRGVILGLSKLFR